jgi:uncharacterized integral membrane protein
MRLRRNPRRLLAPSIAPLCHSAAVRQDGSISTPTDTHGTTGSGAPAKRSRADSRRLIAAAILGGLAVVFAVINRHEVKVNWLFGTWETPLIVVIAVAFFAGAALGAFATRRRAKAKRRPPA